MATPSGNSFKILQFIEIYTAFYNKLVHSFCKAFVNFYRGLKGMSSIEMNVSNRNLGCTADKKCSQGIGMDMRIAHSVPGFSILIGTKRNLNVHTETSDTSGNDNCVKSVFILVV